MKTFRSTMFVAFVLSLFSNGIQAQILDPKLNQMELDRQFLGLWKAVKGEATTTIECRSFYNGVETYFKTEEKGKIVVENKLLLGYDKKTDRLLECSIGSDADDIVVYVAWFTSKTRMVEVLLKDVSKLEKARNREIFEFLSPDSFMLTSIENDKVMATLTFQRIK